jgi:hypothetical protein
MKDMLAVLPDVSKFTTKMVDEYGEYEYYDSNRVTKDSNEALKELRKISDCPGCIMAALRIKGIPTPMVTDFNFKEESKKAWAIFNESQDCGW